MAIGNKRARCYTARAAMTRAPNKCGWLMRGRKESCGHTEAIHNLPPELREMILKEYISIKIKGKKEMGWGKVHENILKLPFCECEQKIVRMVICVEYPDCYFEGCCFSCLEKGGTINYPLVRRSKKKSKLLIESDIDYVNFLEICSWNGYDWHE